MTKARAMAREINDRDWASIGAIIRASIREMARNIKVILKVIFLMN